VSVCQNITQLKQLCTDRGELDLTNRYGNERKQPSLAYRYCDVPILKSNSFVHVSGFLFKSNLPYFNMSDKDLTVFEADQFIYFIRLVAMDRTCVSPIFEYSKTPL